jgi:hypothetical protein
MTTWHRKGVGDGIEAYRNTCRLFDTVMAFGKAEVPATLGVFSHYDLENNVVCWWFSPEADFLARMFGAEPCQKPAPCEGFCLLVGETGSWKAHFPDYVAKNFDS